MLALTKENIRTITETIDKAEITFSHLREDLIDHVCCEMEEQINQGNSFQQAFDRIRERIGIGNLHDVQEKTVLNVDKNYCLMKNVMKISGVISTSILMVGSLFKINHWPGASFLIFLGFIVLGFLFLPSSCYVMNKISKEKGRALLFLTAFLGSFGFVMGVMFKINHWPGGAMLLLLGIGVLCLLFFPTLLVFLLRSAKSGKEKTVYIISIISAIIYLYGLLAKFNHWPGGTQSLTIGAIFFIVLFIPFYTRLNFKQEEHVKPAFIYLIVSFSWFFMFSMLISLGMSDEIKKGFSMADVNNEYYIDVIGKHNQKTYNQLKGTEPYSKLIEIKSLSDNTVEYIESIKGRINQEKDKEYSNLKPERNNLTQIGWDNSEIPTAIMLGTEENPSGEASELKKKLDDLRIAIIEHANSDKEITALVNRLLNTAVPKDAPGWANSWERLYFDRVNIAGCENLLAGYQKNIRLAEYAIIQHALMKEQLVPVEVFTKSENK